MQSYRQFIWTVLMVLGAEGGAVEKCPASGRTNFSLSIASRRNLTGHWIVTVDGVAEFPGQASSGSSPLEVALDMGHRTASCEDKQTVQLVATAVLNAVAPGAGVTAPPADYEVVNGLGYYKMHTVVLTWEQARDKCVEEGGHLVIINSEKEAEVVRTLMKREQSKIHGGASLEWSWVGFDDIVTEGKYITVLGEPLSSSGYTQWYQTAGYNSSNFNCGSVYEDGLQLPHPCAYKFAFICEISAQ